LFGAIILIKDKKISHRGHATTLKQDLVTAGREILSTNGVAALSLRAVARAANVSAMAPYRHFADKEALLAAIAIAGYERIRDSNLKAATFARPEDKLRSACHAYLDFAIESPSLYRLVFGDYIPNDSNHPEFAVAAGEAFGTLETLMASLPRVKDPHIASIALWSMLHGFTSLFLDHQMETLDERARPERAKELLEALMEQWTSGAFALS
jgi:AcrR family transcriptional regulator